MQSQFASQKTVDDSAHCPRGDPLILRRLPCASYHSLGLTVAVVAQQLLFIFSGTECCDCVHGRQVLGGYVRLYESTVPGAGIPQGWGDVLSRRRLHGNDQVRLDVFPSLELKVILCQFPSRCIRLHCLAPLFTHAMMGPN